MSNQALNYVVTVDDMSLEEAYSFTTGTFLIGRLTGATYDDLVRNFGVPTINVPSGDEKVQVEWVFNYDGQPYTLYDWKTFDRDYTLQELDVWHIGGKQRNHDFFGLLEESIDRNVIVSSK